MAKNLLLREEEKTKINLVYIGNGHTDTIKNQFGSDMLYWKPQQMSWSNYYMELFNYFKAGLNGNKHYWDKDVQNRPYIQYLYESKIPKMWLEKHHLGWNQEGIDFGIINGRFDVVKEIEELGFIPTNKAVEIAATKGYPEFFPYVLHEEVMIPHYITFAIASNHYNFIGYITARDITWTISMLGQDFDSIKKLLSYDVLHSAGIPGKNDVEVIKNYFEYVHARLANFVENKEFTMLLLNFDIPFSSIMIRRIIEFGYLDIYKKIVLKGHVPDISDIDVAIELNKFDILNFIIYTLNYMRKPFDESWVEVAIASGYHNALNYLLSKNVEFNKEKLCDMAYYGFEIYDVVLKIFAENNIFPSERCFNYNTHGSGLRILKLLETNGMKLNSVHANYALQHDNDEILDYLKTKNIFPDNMIIKSID